MKTTAAHTAETATTPELLVRLGAMFTAMCDEAHMSDTDAEILHTFTYDDMCDKDAGLTTATASAGGEHESADSDYATSDPMWLFWGYLCDMTHKSTHTKIGVGTERIIDDKIAQTMPNTHIATARRDENGTTVTVTIETTFTHTHAGKTTTVTKGETCTYTRADLR